MLVGVSACAEGNMARLLLLCSMPASQSRSLLDALISLKTLHLRIFLGGARWNSSATHGIEDFKNILYNKTTSWPGSMQSKMEDGETSYERAYHRSAEWDMYGMYTPRHFQVQAMTLTPLSWTLWMVLRFALRAVKIQREREGGEQDKHAKNAKRKTSQVELSSSPGRSREVGE